MPKKKSIIPPTISKEGSINDRSTKIIELRQAGVSLKEIGSQFGISFQRVGKIIDAYNESAPPSERVISRARRIIDGLQERIQGLLSAGKSRAEIVAELEISDAKLYRVCCELRKRGVEIPDFRKRSIINLDKARRLRRNGVTLKTIAGCFGVSISSVREALRKK